MNDDVTRFQLDLLAAIERERRERGAEPKGLDVKAALQAVYGTEVHHGRLYPNLDRLADAGLIEKGAKDRRSNWYRLTDAGRAVLGEHAEWYGLDDAVESEGVA